MITYLSEAGKLIYSIYKDPVKGKKEKKQYEENIGLHEVFLESVPTAFIISIIMVSAGKDPFSSLGNILWSFHGTFIDGISEFFLTFSLSLISASLGMARCLKNGVARPIAVGGSLDGLLSARHLLALFASGFSCMAKGNCLEAVIYLPDPNVIFMITRLFKLLLISGNSLY